MSKDPTTDGVTPERLAQLFKMAMNNQSGLNEETDITEISESLSSLLASHLPVRDAITESLSGIIQKVYKELAPLSEKTLEQLLLDPVTNVTVIRHIKTYLKERVKTTVSSAEREAATVVYYLAIAHALVYHDECITGLSYSDLLKSFRELILNDWLKTDFIQLFNNAIIKYSENIKKKMTKETE